MARIPLLAVMTIALSTMFFTQPPRAAVRCDGTFGPDIVCTSLGAIRGVPDKDTFVFRGIPYARPPIASLRWRPPQPGPAWSDVRDGSKFGAVCPQVIANDVA